MIEKGEVTDDNKTEKPSSEAYEGTEATIVVNEAAQPTDEDTPAPVQLIQETPGESQSDQNEERVNVISEENNYTENRGDANADEYSPVQENEPAQQEANEAETPVAEAPGVDALQRAAQIAEERRAAESAASATAESEASSAESTTTTPETTTASETTTAPEATTTPESTTTSTESTDENLDEQAEELLEYLRSLGIE